MSFDPIARALAQAALSASAEPLSHTAVIDLFTNLPALSIESRITVLVTSGFGAVGTGAGTYVNDGLATSALASAYPALCGQSADGRYWRLAGAEVTVEHAGALGQAGHNDQPAIQQAHAYAAAVGIGRVRFGQEAYELWGTTRTNASNVQSSDGHALVITADVEMVGAPGGTTLTLKNSGGGYYGTSTQTVSNGSSGTTPWFGGGVFIWPTTPGGTGGAGTINRFTMRSITVAGGVPYTLSGTAPAGNSGPGQTGVNLSSKGFWCQDRNVNAVYFYDVEIWGFLAEVCYFGGTQPRYIYADNLRVHDSPQSAWNPGTNATVHARDLQAYNSYQAAEILGGYGHTYDEPFFGQSASMSISAGAFGGSGVPYNYPARPFTGAAPPWVTLNNARFEQFTSPINVGAYVRGTLFAVDAGFASGYVFSPNTRELYLRIEHVCDQQSGGVVFALGGPPTTTTQMFNAATGTYSALPETCVVDITMRRTENAIANGYFYDGFQVSGLVDPTSIKASVEGNARYAWNTANLPASGFAIPLIVASNIKGTAQPFGGGYITPTMGATTTLDVAYPAYALYPGSTGTATITLLSDYTYADGQEVVFYHNLAGAGRCVTFPQGGAGLNLARSRTLYQYGDLLRLRYDANLNLWGEVLYLTGNTAAPTSGLAATTAQLLAGTSNSAFATPAAIMGAATEATLAYAASVTPNLAAGLNYNLTLTGNVSLANPTGAISGMSGTIRLIQDATGSRVITYGSQYKFPGGAAANGVLSTTAGAIDLLAYTVGADGNVYCSLSKAFQ